MNPDERPDWVQANPAAIEASLQRALAKPSGGWFVVGDSRTFRSRRHRPCRWPVTVDGSDLVLWRPTPEGDLLGGPAACPHLGADLSTGQVLDGCLVCPWHGLRLTAAGHGHWRTVPVHDDGVLVWVQPDPTADDATPAPIIAPRPDVHLSGVIRRDATCEVADVIANRLDPWHGAHLHPYAFGHLRVVDPGEAHIDLRVSYRVVGSVTVDVTARFHVPESRTIVMTIIDGEGTGSVVETHATPLVRAAPGRPPRTAVIEATMATSDRHGFVHARRGAAVARPLIRWAANRLWADDAAYAERRYALRMSGWKPGS